MVSSLYELWQFSSLRILQYIPIFFQSHDRLYYRIKAIRQMTSSWKKSDMMEQEVEETVHKAEMAETDGKGKWT